MQHTGMSGEPRCHTCGQPLGYWATDWLTGLPDRWGWQDRAPHAVARASHAREPLALLIIDVDWFKEINDTAGHMVGDTVLRAVSACLQDVSSPDDVLGRYGGDEFVVLLPSSDVAQARHTAGEIHRRVRGLVVGIPAPRPEVAPTLGPLSVSVGLAVHRPEDGEYPTLDELFMDADSALLAAKRHGRARTCAVRSGARHDSTAISRHGVFDVPDAHQWQVVSA